MHGPRPIYQVEKPALNSPKEKLGSSSGRIREENRGQ